MDIVHNLECGDSSVNVDRYQNLANYTYSINEVYCIVCKLYFNETVSLKIGMKKKNSGQITNTEDMQR